MTQAIGDILDSVLTTIVRDKRFVADNPRDWSAGKDFIKRRIAEIMTACSFDAEQTYYKLRDLCESPIECLGFAALLQGFPSATVVRTKAELREHPDWQIAIVPQMPHKGYRLDFAVIRRDNRCIHSLECDGRQHKTSAAFKADVDRTVNLWKAGVLVWRVDGSALCRNPIIAIEPFIAKVWGHR